MLIASATFAPVMAQGNAYKKKGGGYAPPSQQRSHNNSNRNGKVAAGIAAAVIGGIIINEVARSQSRGDSGDGRLSCRQLENRCEDGQNWACRKLDREC